MIKKSKVTPALLLKADQYRKIFNSMYDGTVPWNINHALFHLDFKKAIGCLSQDDKNKFFAIKRKEKKDSIKTLHKYDDKYFRDHKSGCLLEI